MADVIHDNFINLLVMNRFGIQLGFGDKTLDEVCAKYDVNSDLFILICNIFYNHNFEPNSAQIENYPLKGVLDFLKKSHQYYRENSLPRLQKALNDLVQTCSPDHAKALETFFNEYYAEIDKHFADEDKHVFPYVEKLLNKQTDTNFTIQQFEDNHENIEEKLEDLKNIIIKYIPSNNNDSLRQTLLEKLFIFEEDLNRHALIEDKLLVPMVLKIEQA